MRALALMKFQMLSSTFLHNKFVPKNFVKVSFHFEEKCPKTATFQYLGSSVEGFFGNDTVRFGTEYTEPLIVPGTVFGQAERIAPLFGQVSDSR